MVNPGSLSSNTGTIVFLIVRHSLLGLTTSTVKKTMVLVPIHSRFVAKRLKNNVDTKMPLWRSCDRVLRLVPKGSKK